MNGTVMSGFAWLRRGLLLGQCWGRQASTVSKGTMGIVEEDCSRVLGNAPRMHLVWKYMDKLTEQWNSSQAHHHPSNQRNPLVLHPTPPQSPH